MVYIVHAQEAYLYTCSRNRVYIISRYYRYKGIYTFGKRTKAEPNDPCTGEILINIEIIKCRYIHN